MPDVENLLRSGIPHQVVEQPNEATHARSWGTQRVGLEGPDLIWSFRKGYRKI